MRSIRSDSALRTPGRGVWMTAPRAASGIGPRDTTPRGWCPTCSHNFPHGCRGPPMPLDKLASILARHVADLEEKSTAKGAEAVVTRVIPPTNGRGPRFLLEGAGSTEFIRMNSNSYLGMSLRPPVVQ